MKLTRPPVEEGFEYARAAGHKIKCIYDNIEGWPGGAWMEAHREEHMFPCEECELVFPTSHSRGSHMKAHKR